MTLKSYQSQILKDGGFINILLYLLYFMFSIHTVKCPLLDYYLVSVTAY